MSELVSAAPLPFPQRIRYLWLHTLQEVSHGGSFYGWLRLWRDSLRMYC